jgi:hypothetical protein
MGRHLGFPFGTCYGFRQPNYAKSGNFSILPSRSFQLKHWKADYSAEWDIEGEKIEQIIVGNTKDLMHDMFCPGTSLDQNG